MHTSTREVLAVYAIDEARMELVITLAPNYPLGAVKVECGKQIGGRASSRNVGMQLTIFLTHQVSPPHKSTINKSHLIMYTP